MAAAQRALNHNPHNPQPERPLDYRSTTGVPAMDPGKPMSAKSCMLSGHMYNPADPELVKDRERSRVACGRFNTQAFTGSSIQETERCFRLIMDPETSVPATAYRSPTERVGNNLRVEAPFRCEYGYNLRIGDNVTIDSGCVFKDPREIYIGDNTRIGPNVTVCGESTPLSLRFRSYSRGYIIKIGQNVFIGAGVTIAPSEHTMMGNNKNELTIGDNAYISAGTVVTTVRPANVLLHAGSWLTQNLGCPSSSEICKQLQSHLCRH